MSHSSQARPGTKALLPFRVLDAPFLVLEYEADAFGQPVPCTVRDTLAEAILKLMKLYWDLEASVDGLCKERDEALAAVSKVEGELKAEQRIAEGLRNQARKKEK